MPDHDSTPQHLAAAIALHRQGKLAEAEQAYRRILSETPHAFDALHLLGVLTLQRGQAPEGLALIARALSVRPDSAEAWSTLALGQARLRRYGEALASYDRVVALKPGDAAAHASRGNALMELRRFADALAAYDRAIALNPGHAAAHHNRGTALKELSRHGEALAAYDRAIALQPDYAEAFNNRGAALKDLRRYDEALASFARAVALRPGYAEAHYNEALCRLLLGEFEIGWQKYDWGWRRATVSPRRHADIPAWLGEEPVAGKTLLVHAESGLGDAIQFCRYVPLLAAQGARVIVEVPPVLKVLMRSLEGAESVLGQGEAVPAVDLQCPMFGLPRAFKTALGTVPNRVPYLAADRDRVLAWRAEIGRQGLKIGIACSGNPLNAQDHQRSLPLSLFALLLRRDRRLFYLQKDRRPDDAAFLAARPEIRDLHHLALEETAAAIECLDLVISADTSIAHLAGALGKPVWIALPYAADWRWLADREDSPWYPGARLFRQQRMGDWEAVMTRLADALPTSK